MPKRWENLPKEFQNEDVKPYHDILRKKIFSLILKRIFDIVFSLILIIILSPVMIILAVLIKCEDGGSIFFRQVRITKNGKEFRIFKFRTMVMNADKLGAKVTKDKDERITKMGGKLRNFRLDELPQLFNVLTGDMSFVGTRPEVPKYVKKYSDEMLATLLMPAGVTSLASIKYKDESKLIGASDDPDKIYIEKILPEKMKYNLQSIKEFNFMNDIKILFKTVGAVIKG